MYTNKSKKILLWTGRLIATGFAAATPFITLIILRVVFG